MTVRTQPNSAKIAITSRPTVNAPVISGVDMSFTGTPIRASGEVILLGDAGDSAAGWRLGFIQAQWIETNWCYYRGQTNNDGSIFIQRGRPPARPSQACRDCVDGSPVNDVFYSSNPAHGEVATGTAASSFPLTLQVSHFDRPSETCLLVENNSLTHKPNFLAEAQLEFHFCTVLSLRDPHGGFHHLLSFYWNLHWQARFHPTSHTLPSPGFRIEPLAAGTAANVGQIIQGGVNDPRFNGVLTTAQTQTCNQVFRAARAAVSAPGSQNRHERRVWENFDVRRA